MRLIDADRLPVTHGVFTPIGGSIILEYDAVMLEDVEAAPTVQITGTQAGANDRPPVRPYSEPVQVGRDAMYKRYYCAVCSRRINRGDKYCCECGNKVDWSKENERSGNV